MEIHHVLPRTMGGKDIKENYVMLTYPEHVVAHILLHLMYPDLVGLATAAMFMAYQININDLYNSISNKLLKLEVLKDLKKISSERWYKAAVCFKDSTCSEILKIYNKQSDVESDGFSISHVSCNIHGKCKSSGGYFWMRLSEVIEKYPEAYQEFCNKLDSGEPIDSPKPIEQFGLPSVCCDLNDNPLFIFKPETAKEAGYNWERIKDTERGKTQKTYFGYKFYNLEIFKGIFPNKNLDNLQDTPPKPISVLDTKVIVLCNLNENPISVYNDKRTLSRINPLFTLGRIFKSCTSGESIYNRFKVFSAIEFNKDLTNIPKNLDLNLSIVICNRYNDIKGIFKSQSELKNKGISIINSKNQVNTKWYFRDDFENKYPGKLDEYLKDPNKPLPLPKFAKNKSTVQYQIKNDGSIKVINIFNSVKDTERIGGFKDNKLISNALNHSKECYGFNWMFEHDFKQKYPKN